MNNVVIKISILLISILSSINAISQNSKKRLDGIIGKVGSQIVLESDINRALAEFKASGRNIAKMERCDILKLLMENKMFVHQAVQDSIVVEDVELNAQYENQMEAMVEALGSVEQIVKMYGKKDKEELEIIVKENIRNNLLANKMQESVVSNVKIAPWEVKEFFKSIPENELPMIGEEVEMSEIVISPEITLDQKQEVIDKLNSIRDEIMNGESSFSSKVFVHSEDPGSLNTGGLYTINKKTAFVKEFKDIAFSLKEGEISKPFETQFGYHIILLEKIKDNNTLDVRHILISPKPTEESIANAKEKIETIREEIENQTISFDEAVEKYSTKKDNKKSNGVMMNPRTGETRFDVESLKSFGIALSQEVSALNEGEISKPFFNPNSNYFQIIKVTKRNPKHKANLESDFIKIKELALRNKQNKTLEKWISDKAKSTYIYVDDEYKNCTIFN